MPSDYYPDDAQEPSSEDGSKSESPDTETALIPKSLLAGKDFKPGEEVIFKIVHMYDDEVEIAYATEEKEEEENEPKSAMDESMEDMGKMAGGY